MKKRIHRALRYILHVVLLIVAIPLSFGIGFLTLPPLLYGGLGISGPALSVIVGIGSAAILGFFSHLLQTPPSMLRRRVIGEVGEEALSTVREWKETALKVADLANVRKVKSRYRLVAAATIVASIWDRL